MPFEHLTVRQQSALNAFVAALIGDTQLLAAFAATRCENGATSGRSHALAESVLVAALANGGLKCPFHDTGFRNRERKDRQPFGNSAGVFAQHPMPLIAPPQVRAT